MNMMKKCFSLLKEEKGLTLIEVLIAATLMAFMGIGIVALTNNSFDTKEKVTREDRRPLQLEMAFSLISQDIQQIYTPLFFEMNDKDQEKLYQTKEKFDLQKGWSSSGLPAPTFEHAQAQSFLFFTSSFRKRFEDAHQSHYAWVLYKVLPSGKVGGKDTFALYRSLFAEYPYATTLEDMEATKAFKVLDHLTHFQFFFWNPRTKKFVERLQDIGKGEWGTKAIKIQLSWIQGPIEGEDGPLENVEHQEERIFMSAWPKFTPKKEKLSSSQPSSQPSSPPGEGGSPPQSPLSPPLPPDIPSQEDL
jgi:hypothetical protein